MEIVTRMMQIIQSSEMHSKLVVFCDGKHVNLETKS